MAKGKKQPRTAHGFPSQSKIPKTSDIENQYKGMPFRWGVDRVQLDGIYGFHLCDHQALFAEVIFKLQEFSNMTWAEVVPGTGSHEVEFDKLIRPVQERVREVLGDELDLVSLRLRGQPRVWGVREGGLCSILFFDPLHEICPSPKKHT